MSITFSAVENPGIIEPTAVVNSVVVEDGLGNTWSHQVRSVLNGYTIYLPLVQRE